MMDAKLIQKYNVPGPRYTSYPTVPYWSTDEFNIEVWKETFKESTTRHRDQGISLYIHLPFCEKLCTFCGCIKRITKNHQVEDPYIDTLLKEWHLYLDLLGFRPKLRELHLGGGTPTFFEPENLKRLLSEILSSADSDQIEISFEGHPNNTTYDHLRVLYELGSRRVSFGVQDYDPIVQKAINRIQPFENVEKVHHLSRELGYNSISHDLVFGLPHQNEAGITNTIEKTLELKPDRISFYSYAHVPWIKGIGQRGFNEDDLPKDAQKRKLYELGKNMFFDHDYYEIGMDHFALRTDDMYKAMVNNVLHRNFMGYTTTDTKVMIGLGMSAIGDTWYSFSQNIKSVEEYSAKVHDGQFPIFRGHLLNSEDLIVRQHILNLMCHFYTSWEDKDLQFKELPECLTRLEEMEKDGLIIIGKNDLTVPEKSRPFIRNVCMAFDMHLIRNKPSTKTFSMTI
ncbi:MAG: oxygen-independent coproporphyrinogen III oxidase [Saprospiraceae bacterium]|nr:oxygen-independent coproporphyrinogen III oxidase [Saprospiraceae bacterium]